MIRPLLGIALSLVLQGCAYSVHQVYYGSMDRNVRLGKNVEQVEVATKQFVFLGFEFGSEYIDQAYKKLESQCSGRIAQVTTEHQTAFLFLSYNQKINLKALCIKKT